MKDRFPEITIPGALIKRKSISSRPSSIKLKIFPETKASKNFARILKEAEIEGILK